MIKRNLLVAALGLFTGALGSSLAAGCGSCPEQQPLPTGTFGPSTGTAAESDYVLTISADKKTVTETFTRSGKAYRIDYRAVDE
jgi:hypothetical protein